MKLIGTSNNPFVNIAINIANNKESFDKSSFQLIDFLIDYGHLQDFNLNEEFFVKNNEHYSSDQLDYYTNFFNTIFIINDSFNPHLINKLVEGGLKFNPFFTNSKNEVVGDILFTRTELNSNRNIFLFNLYLKQNGIKDFTDKIVTHNTLNKCIAQNQLDTAEFILKHVSIDLCNKNLETPIMFAKNLKTLTFLANYNPYWGQKNALGNNCSYYFSGIQDDLIKKDMINFYVKELSKDTRSILNDSDYVEKRLEETLIQLVTKDATKVELQTFLKKYKLKNADILTNKYNRTLGHICVNKEDFARLSLFPKTDLYHIDNNGYNIFTTLFGKRRFTSDTKNKAAKTILLSCLENPEKNISQENFNRLIEIPFASNSINSSDFLPEWILKDHFLRNEVLQCFKISSSEISFSNYINNGSFLSPTEKLKLYFDLFSNLINDFDINMLKKDNIFNKIFSTVNYNGQNEHYFDEQQAEMLIVLLEKCNNVGKINLDSFLNDKFSNINSVLLKLKESFMINHKETYENLNELTTANNLKFYENVCQKFFKFLSEHKLISIIKHISEDLINETLKNEHDDTLNDFFKIFTYLKLNTKLSNKNIKTQTTKI